jgi:DNA-binding response OmpR family regulator
MKIKILWVEGKRADSPSFITGLRRKGYQIDLVATGNEALEHMPELQPHLAVINTVSLRTSGKRICRSLRNAAKTLPIVLIVDAQRGTLDESCANVILSLPFTMRKLINRIEPLLPWNMDAALRIGPITLDLERRRVRCQEREAHLTPRLVHLLRLLMDHHGEALRREDLFRQVWKTEYTGDTRALDVHISWLRQAIEDDPRQPVFLRTIRGLGYRLDI